MGRYEDLIEKCESLEITPPERRAYTKAYTNVKNFIDNILDKVQPQRHDLPDNVIITGDFLSALGAPDGKTVYISGRNLTWKTKHEEGD